MSKLELTDKGDGTTGVDVEFKISNDRAMNLASLQRRLKRISFSFSQAVDDGVMQVAIAAAAKLETRWSQEVRDRVIEECLFEDDDLDDTSEEQTVAIATVNTVPKKTPKPRESLYLGGGRDGVFPDYSEANMLNATYSGEIGLRLVDAVVQRAKERLPRVIAIGDVHGCIDELQDLLRQCDYRPGDLVVLLVRVLFVE